MTPSSSDLMRRAALALLTESIDHPPGGRREQLRRASDLVDALARVTTDDLAPTSICPALDELVHLALELWLAGHLASAECGTAAILELVVGLGDSDIAS